jgi:hypothetical protein
MSEVQPADNQPIGAPILKPKKSGKMRQTITSFAGTVVVVGAALAYTVFAGGDVPTYNEKDLKTVEQDGLTLKIDTSWKKSEVNGETVYTDYKDKSKTGADDPINAQIGYGADYFSTTSLTQQEYTDYIDSVDESTFDPYIDNICKTGTNKGKLTKKDVSSTQQGFVIDIDCDAKQVIGDQPVQLKGQTGWYYAISGKVYVYEILAEDKVWNNKDNSHYFGQIIDSFKGED